MTEARILFGQITGDLGRRFCVVLKRKDARGAWRGADVDAS